MTRRGSSLERTNKIWTNDKFMGEAANAATLTAFYASAPALQDATVVR